jgi:hypothetical protein
VLEQLAWRNWGQPEATATGVERCKRDCVPGAPQTAPVPLQVLVYRIVGDHYTRARVTFHGGFETVQHLDEMHETSPAEEQRSKELTQQENERQTNERIQRLELQLHQQHQQQEEVRQHIEIEREARERAGREEECLAKGLPAGC